MKNRKRSKKIKYLLIILLVVTLGFALLTVNLKIDGLGNIKNMNWDVHWDNAQVTEGSVVDTVPTLDNKKTTATFSFNLNGPSDYYEFTIDAVNSGGMNVFITAIDNKIYEIDGETEATLPSYIHYDVTYADETPLRVNDMLWAGSMRRYKVRIEYDSNADSDDYPESDLNYVAELKVNYAESDATETINARLKSGKYINNLMYNLAYRANENQINLSGDSSFIPFSYDVYSYIEHFKFASKSQYNAIKDSLTEDNIISLSTNQPEEEIIPIATSGAISDVNSETSNTPVYMWYDKSSKTIYVYSEEDRIYLNEDSSEMFWGFYDMKSIELYRFFTKEVTNMNHMFRLCGVTSLDISNFDTSNVTSMEYMFFFNLNLKTIYASNLFNTDKVENDTDIFKGCFYLVGGNGNGSGTGKEYAIIDTPSTPGYFTKK